VISWNFGFGGVLSPLTVWMDGRPHPSKYAPHTSSGFTTGKWENDILTTYTTHLVAGSIRRNGAPHSDEATITLRLIRHGDLLIVSGRFDDPIYLDGPYHLARVYQQTGGAPPRAVRAPCSGGSEGAPEGTVRTTSQDRIRSSRSLQSATTCRSRRCSADASRCIRSTARR
jgi:hypothetical protein